MRNLDQNSENNWSHLVSSMNFDIYAIMCDISVHAIAEAKRSASFFENTDTCTVEPRYLELAYFELPFISKWKSGPCFNMKLWQQVTK